MDEEVLISTLLEILKALKALIKDLQCEVRDLHGLNEQLQQQLADEVGAAWELAGDVRVTPVELWAQEVEG